MIEVQRQRAVLELPAGRRHLLVAVEEPSARACAAAGDLEAERNLEAVDDDGGVPEAGEWLVCARVSAGAARINATTTINQASSFRLLIRRV